MQASAQPTPRADAGVGWTPFLFLLPFLLFLIIFWFVPLAGGVKLSLQANGFGEAEYVGLNHYYLLAKDERFFKAIRNSFVYTLGSSPTFCTPFVNTSPLEVRKGKRKPDKKILVAEFKIHGPGTIDPKGHTIKVITL